MQEEILHMRRAFRAEQRGENGTAILAAVGISLSEDPGKSNVTIPEGTVTEVPQLQDKDALENGRGER